MNRLNFYLNIIQNSLNDVDNYINKISSFLPINYPNYNELIAHHKDTIDAIAFRFNKIQSTLGEKVFKYFLEEIGYDTNKSFLEILNEIEKLGIVDRKKWIEFREIRNKVSHDYPEEIGEIIENLNKMINSFNEFKKILNKIKEIYEINKKWNRIYKKNYK